MRKFFAAFFTLTFFLSTPAVFAAKNQNPFVTKNGVVVSDHYLASQVGADILKAGGNAVDAAIATGFALAVVSPSGGNIGGGGFLLAALPGQEVTSFDFREKAPLAAREDLFVDARGRYKEEDHHDGYLSVGVPGTVAGFFLVHEKHGRLPMTDLLEPAIRLAEEGFSITWRHAEDLLRHREALLRYPASARALLKNGIVPYREGELWRQPDLARTLRRIREEGRAGFYEGAVPALVAKAMRENGGLITEEDFRRYEAKERPPVRGNYRGYTVYSMGPPSSGGVVVLEMLNILEGFDLSRYPYGSAGYLHLLAKTMWRAYKDRALYLGDPDFNPQMPVKRLTSKAYAVQRRLLIQQSLKALAAESGNTTHYSVADAEGGAVVVTYTLERFFGSKIVAEGTGFLLNNEMGDFNPVPAYTDRRGQIGTKPNLVAPEKRMLSSMTPTLVMKDKKPYLLIGSTGGRVIPNTVFQVIVNVIDFKMSLEEAVSALRVHHQWMPDEFKIEQPGFGRAVTRQLRRWGHVVIPWKRSSAQGRAMGILLDPATGDRIGFADPRADDGGARGY